MLKGSEISDIHNLTTLNSGNIKHAALIVSEDWTGLTVNNENLQIDIISQIIMWLIISGVTVLTIYDQSGRLRIGKEVVKNAVAEKLLEIILNEKSRSKHNKRYSLLEKMILNQNRQALQKYVHQNSNNKSELLKNLTNLRMDLKIDQHDSKSGKTTGIVINYENDKTQYLRNLQTAINAPLNGMSTYNRINKIQNYSESKIEPEVALVLDPKNRKSIFGFNFWSIRLTEFIYFDRVVPSFESDFVGSMKKYLKIERRFGK